MRGMGPQDTERDIQFPLAGIDRTRAFFVQSAKPINGRKPRYTCADAVNVRGYDAVADRLRGGSRPGLSKLVSTPLVAGWIVQHLNVVVGSGFNPPGGGMPQVSQSGRVVTLVAVAQGNLKVWNPGDTSWTAVTNNTVGTPPLNFTGVMASAVNAQILYFADGTNWVYYDPSTNSAEDWTVLNPMTMELPEDADGNTPRLICTWRGRTVVSGLLGDGQNWFMSQLGDPRNWNYSPASPSSIDAVAGNNSPLGLIGDVITALIPLSDDELLFGGQRTIYRLEGDPLAGGVIKEVTREIGVAWGTAWCRDPAGRIYFVSNLGSVYLYDRGQITRISQAVEPLLQAINTGESVIQLAWGDKRQILKMYVTPRTRDSAGNARATTHYEMEVRTGAWWKKEYANNNHNPLSVCVLEGNTPDDRSVLEGGWDGYVRREDESAETDDGTPIASSVIIGPFLTPIGDEMNVKELQPILGTESADVDYQILHGETAEEALDGDPEEEPISGTFLAGRNTTEWVNRSAYAIYLKLSAVGRWSMESIRIIFGPRGGISRRRSRSR